MDYIEAFRNLKTNNKYSRKSPHKAILLLTIIEMYENNLLSENMILYDDELKCTFHKVWERTLKDEPLFHAEAYFPFWYMQSEDFWHIVPNRGKEDFLTLLRDTHVKPSEAKLKDCVKYAELDEDLYFLMTLPSGRSTLKRALMETYTNLSAKEIDQLAESKDNTIDYSISALSDYEKILSPGGNNVKAESVDINNELVNQFQKLNEDIQIILNLQYFSFLKSHRNEREMFKEICPNVYELFDKIINHPVKQGDIAPSFAFTYDNFLSDLKISLMSEENSMKLIDKISEAIDILRGRYKDNEEENSDLERETIIHNDEKEHLIPINETDSSFSDLEIEHVFLDSRGNITETSPSSETILEKVSPKEDRKGKPWTSNEEELITLYFKQGRDIATIANNVGRTELSIKSRLAKLGLIEYVYGQEDNSLSVIDSETGNGMNENDFTVKNTLLSCIILNKFGEKVFSTEGKFKFIGKKLYRFNLKHECFTIKDMQYTGGIWRKGSKKIVAYPKSDLYNVIDNAVDYITIIEDIDDRPTFEECKLKANGLWYCYDGTLLESDQKTIESKENIELNIDKNEDFYSQFSVKLGDTLKLFPSQHTGKVVDLILDNKGQRKIVVRSEDGSIASVYDNRFFYKKIKIEKKETLSISKKAKTKREDVSLTPKHSSKVAIGYWIKWKPTGDIGKVVGFKTVGSTTRLVLQLKGGSELEVYDNPQAYDIIIK